MKAYDPFVIELHPHNRNKIRRCHRSGFALFRLNNEKGLQG
jgi:hypothetical protein